MAVTIFERDMYESEIHIRHPQSKKDDTIFFCIICISTNAHGTVNLKKALLKVRQSRNDFFKPTFLPKTNEQIQLYYYETSGRLVFIRLS